MDDAVGLDDYAGDLLDLDEALRALEDEAPRPARVVELRFFGGLSVEETAEVLGVSPRTVKGDWALARAWLLDRLSGAGRQDVSAPETAAPVRRQGGHPVSPGPGSPER